ncbi:SDR family NAD(P)-dependent oxidoreductase [Haloferax namakaokahaiae]|uniref:SDR family NAD(P)-dependent oxidoreductase n=1 Tax=Haloferax namakaokahaiae TaxID=1748331 RepID=A0ABD5ZEZ1_9EURY
MTELSGKTVLVTGGCGSIGSKIVSRSLDKGAKTVRVFDNDEKSLFRLQHQIGDERLRCLLGDVRDRDRLRLALEGIDVVFHAAALKHVELNEYNPFETVQTNVVGTQNLIRAALEEEVESFVAVSTDKASNPASVMGATKLLSERLVIAANAYKGDRETTFGCVRFGNVLGSSGSVVPVFYEQIKDGGPVTVTSPEMTRFVMPIGDAVDLVLSSYERMQGGEVFVLKMPTFDVGTLAEAMIAQYASEFGYDEQEVDIEIIGPRPGERWHEKLISEDELSNTDELEDVFVIHPDIDMPSYDITKGNEHTLEREYTSESGRRLSHSEIIDMIESAGVVENDESQ